jgi:alanine dehydrogenase
MPSRWPTKGWEQASRDDTSLALGLNTHAKQLINMPVGEALGFEAVSPAEVFALLRHRA